MDQERITDMSSAARDLRWYYARTETGPLKSSFEAMRKRLEMGRTARELTHRHDPTDDALDEAARAGSIARVLRALDAKTADLLQRGFGPDWPAECAAIGDLSGLAPLTEAARKAFRASPSHEGFEEWLHQLFKQTHKPKVNALLARVEAEALAIRNRAVGAYLAVRRKVGRHGR